MATTYIYRNASSSVTSTTTFTFSMWFKRAKVGTNETLFCHENESSHTQKLDLHIVDDQFRMGWYNGSAEYNLDTKMVFRDPNAWYHLVFRYDTTQSTTADRVRIYVNGVLQELEQINGSDPTSQYPSQNITMDLGTKKMVYGRYQASSPSRYWHGCMSHLIYCDGQSYAPTQFGETDTTTGEWRIKDLSASDLTWGSNGHWLLKDGISITDASSNSNNFTASGNLTFTHDNPSNNFATLNAISSISHPTLEHGNNSISNSASDGDRVYGSVPSKAGYYEVKLGLDPDGSSGKGFEWGVFDCTNYAENVYSVNSARVMKTNYGYNTHFATQNWGGGNSWENVTTGLDSDAGDILMCAWKNGKVYYGYNGTWFFSANPSNNTDGSTQLPIGDANAYQLAVGKSHVAGMGDCQFNFGNGYFGTTAVTTNSGNGYADANGYGKFNYQVPTGCYALCTKNLNT